MPFGAVATGLLGGAELVSNIYQGIAGYHQTQKGNRMRDDIMRRRGAGEFLYHTPQEARDNVNIAKKAFLDQRLPGATVAEQNIGANTSQAISLARATGRSPAEIMATIVGANNNQNNAINDLATAGAERQLVDQQNLMNANNTLADYTDKEWGYNVYQPYQDDRAYAEDLIGAGNKNIYSALKGAGGTVGALATNDNFMNLFRRNGSGVPGATAGIYGNNSTGYSLPATKAALAGLKR